MNAETDIDDLAPNARLVFKTLQYDGPLTYSEIVQEAPIPEQSLDGVLETLREEDLIVRQYIADDARNRQYDVK